MALFGEGEKAFKFNIVDVEGEELDELIEVIEKNGGEVTDDPEIIVKFTRGDSTRLGEYPRAKLYDVNFIRDCARDSKFLPPEEYRLGHKVPGDEYLMTHFLFGRCNDSRNLRPCENGGESGESCRVASIASKSTQCSHDVSTDREKNDKTGSETLKAEKMVQTEEPEAVNNFKDVSIDESQVVVSAMDIEKYEPWQSGRVAAESVRNVVEKPETGEKTKAKRDKSNVSENSGGAKSQSSRTKNNHTTKDENSSEKIFIALEDSEELSHSSSVDCEDNEYATAENGRENGRNKRVSCQGLPETNCPESMAVVLVAKKDGKNSKRRRNLDSGIMSKIVNWFPRDVDSSSDNGTQNEKEISPKSCKKSNKNSTGSKSLYNSGGAEIVEINLDTTESSDDELEGGTKPDDNSRRVMKKRSSDVGKLSTTNEQRNVRLISNTEGNEERRTRKRRRNEESKSGDETNSRHVRKKNSGKQQARKTWKENDNDTDSTSSSSENENPIRKVRRSHQFLSDSSDCEMMAEHKKKERETQRGSKEDTSKAGPSGMGNNQNYKSSDDEKSTEDEYIQDTSFISDIFTDSDISSTEKDKNTKIPKVKSQSPHGRKPFTPSERKEMLYYLIKRNAISKAKGLVIWKEMINDGYLTHRTPQSLHNQFKKQILPNIENATYLKSADLKKLLALRVNSRRKMA